MRQFFYNRPIFFFSVVCVVTIILSSCRKFVAIQPAPNLIITETIFESDKTAISAASSVYTQLRMSQNLFTNGGLSLYGGLAADELVATAPNTTTEPYFLNDLRPSTFSLFSLFYGQSYKLIYQANAVIEGLDKAVKITDSVRQQLRGEMLVVRALAYFYLSQLFGDIPLVLQTQYEANSLLPRTAVNIVNQQIIDDLLNAKQLLTPHYPSVGKLRPNQFTSIALLARVYLYNRKWANAEREATAVIQSGHYTLQTTSTLGQVFLRNSPETIWEVTSPNESTVTSEALSFIPTSASVIPTFQLAPTLINQFESGDQRMQLWIGKNSINGTDYYYPNKYKQRLAASGSITECLIFFRLPELLLIRAEARKELGNLSGTESAASDLNLLRDRAGTEPIPASTSLEIQSAIHSERQTEFFTEWGHRWLDLKRSGDINTVMSVLKPTTWKSTASLWPIPEVELRYNHFLTQNPG